MLWITKRIVESDYLQTLFSELTDSIKETLGLDRHRSDIVNIEAMKRFLKDREGDSVRISELSGLSCQAVDKVRKDMFALENMKLKDIRALQKVVAFL